MINASLKILATAYDANAEMVSFAIGLGRFFEATIGPARGKGLTPDRAARSAWVAFCDWQGPASGFIRPGSVEIERERVTLRTVGTTGFDVLIGGKVSGEVVKLRDGRYRAMVRGSEKTGVCAMACARLAWLEKTENSC